MMYTKLQRDGVIATGIEVLKGLCERVGVTAEVSNNAAGDVVITVKNPKLGELE